MHLIKTVFILPYDLDFSNKICKCSKSQADLALCAAKQIEAKSHLHVRPYAGPSDVFHQDIPDIAKGHHTAKRQEVLGLPAA